MSGALRKVHSLRDSAAVIAVAGGKSIMPHYQHPDDPTQSILDKIKALDGVNHIEDRDFEVLMVRRTAGGKYSQAYAFPGGQHDEHADANKGWLDPLFTYLGSGISKSLTSMSDRIKIIRHFRDYPDPRPEMFTKYNKEFSEDEQQQMLNTVMESLDDGPLFVPPAFSFKMCALRELFEETGLMIASSLNGGRTSITTPALMEQREDRSDIHGIAQWDSERLSGLQDALHDDPNAMYSLLNDDFIPNINGLYEWSNWCTPCVFPVDTRFDTMFYMTFLGEKPPLRLQDEEVDDAIWVDPDVVLEEALAGHISLPPPQIYELARLANFRSIRALQQWAGDREKRGIGRICPQVVLASDAVRVLVLPGDDLFDKSADFAKSSQSPLKVPQTSQELLSKADKLHRFHALLNEDGSLKIIKLYLNLAKLPWGHISPKPIG